MANKMLIDASHVEETRVVVLRDNLVEELDFESEHKKQIKGNIYLAKITRVEPSLQAAFVDYGGNRHGFLAFSEIHPDYYQIPFSDRQALLKAAAQVNCREAESSDTDSDDLCDAKEEQGDVLSEEQTSLEKEGDVEKISEDAVVTSDSEDLPKDEATVRKFRRQYCIQEVIKNRQILLVQIVKEERGNKGAAVTTYLSLAGRYSVLMPNTPRGEGVSRKITNPVDRKNLKEIARGLEVPPGMGVILRTAGAARTKIEIKRDFEYLMRLWDNVRTLALNSIAPHLVYEEGNLIKRSIRDLYAKDMSEIVVSGEKGYREAKDFMKLLMPSHAKIVLLYRDVHPIFSRSGIEVQLNCLHQPEVTLPSGGYIIISQTEALVAIDVNSGRSTREHSVENTAFQTNLEAAEEIARQLRLRDLAGLIVVDFIDMEEKRNNRAVEKKLKESLKRDRARVQVGCISHFGILEMSRQRIRASVLESTTKICVHCGGAGYVRSQSSIALSVLRSIEDYLLQCTAYNITVHTTSEVVLYLLNQKRAAIIEYEKRFGVSINIVIGSRLEDKFFYIEKGTSVQCPVKIENLVDSSGFDENRDSFLQYDRKNEDSQQDVSLYDEIKGDVSCETRDSQSEDDVVFGASKEEDQEDSLEKKEASTSDGSSPAFRRRRRRRNKRHRRPAIEGDDVPPHPSDILGPVKSTVNELFIKEDDVSSDVHRVGYSVDGFRHSPDFVQPSLGVFSENNCDPTESPPAKKRLGWWRRR
ncbi:ribonuclease E/G [Candidatus Liberibacter sp.]|uniref:Rne/Rng family ribonuclease n=1 Tax=Candidatus Liberibacter sp. TaxID=34022 RepID=UPI0015F56A98|nr:ribonuclease E/G [Candidatus Liberibacter sp.]MBA5723913.1 ribonuclease E/G [Candidatus Liberibacter sp.]